jgi:hypothetical protein
MHSNAINSHVIVREKADTSDGSRGSIAVVHFNTAAEAENLFYHTSSLPQGAADDDSDGSQDDTKYRWVMWYGKGRLIKYRKLDQ